METLETGPSAASFDRRAVLQAGAISAALAAPITAAAAAPIPPSQSNATRRREPAMGTGKFSGARLGRMHDVMAGHVERGYVPGLVTLIDRRGETHVDAIGMTAIGGSDPMARDTIFRIASLSKPLTAAGAMILVEECKLRLMIRLTLGCRNSLIAESSAPSTARSTTPCPPTDRLRCAIS
jgi:CubicO group peptidase (beta-lactamase class C family)